MPAQISSLRRALVLFALAIGAFAIGTSEFAAMSLVPFFAADLGISEPQAGHAISAYALGVVVGAPVIAVLAARIDRRILLSGLMATFAVGNGLSASAGSFGQLMLFRFLSGLPHGAYFGVAALVAASLVSANRRAQSVALVMSGLTVATVIGVPLANWLGQVFGWRTGFALVSAIALTTMALVMALTAPTPPDAGASPMRELGAMRRPQVVLTLLTGAIGFGGIFCVYTYLASTTIGLASAGEAIVPLVLGVFGVGMTLGNFFWAWLGDKAVDRTILAGFLFSAVVLLGYSFATESLWSLLPVALLVGFGSGIGSVVQTRLMDVAGDAQTLAAAGHHSAFNMGNALGPWLGGMAVAAGYGYASTGVIGALLALGGVAIFVVALRLQAQRDRADKRCEGECAPA